MRPRGPRGSAWGRSSALIAGAWLVVAAGPARAAPCVDYTAYPAWISALTVSLPGAVAMSGDVAVVGGSALRVIDVADPTAIREVATYDLHDPLNPRYLGQAGWTGTIGDLATTPDAVVGAGPSCAVFPLQCDIPTPVALAEFGAERRAGAVRIRAVLGTGAESLAILRAASAPGAEPVLVHEEHGVAAGVIEYDDHTAGSESCRYALRWTEARRTHQSEWLDVAAGNIASRLVIDSANPARGPITLRYEVASVPATLEVFAATGRRVRRLQHIASPGRYRTVWDGADDTGRPAAAGVYFVRLHAGGGTKSARIVRLAPH